MIKNLFEKLKRNLEPGLILLFLLALAIRFWGINYGMPLELNIDEPTIVSTTVGLKGDLNPQRFDWPHLYFYINALFYGIFGVIRYLVSLFMNNESWYEAASLFLVSRGLSMIFGALTVLPVFYFTKILFKSRMAAYIAAMIVTFLPIHVDESHFAKLDVAQAFFVALSLVFITRVFLMGQRKDYIWSGILIGLITSIKYNGFLIFLPLLLASLLRVKSFGELKDPKFLKETFINLFLAGILSIVFFFIGTPYALLDHKDFWSYERGTGALWQFENVGTVSWAQFPIELYTTFVPMFKDNMGVGIWLAFMVLSALFLFFNKRAKPYTLLFFPVLLISFYISRFERSPSHYFIFLVPMYAASLGGFLTELLDNKLLQKCKYIGYLVLAAIFVPSIIRSINISYLYSRTDTRNLAYNWVQQNLSETEDFLYVHGDELEAVPFKEKQTEKLKRVDAGSIKVPLPFYLVIGVNDVSPEQILTGKRDPDNVEGNSEPILKEAELVFSTDNVNRHGPPIYIFYVSHFAAD